MSEDPYRQLARSGLAPLVEEVPPGPDWSELETPTPTTPPVMGRVSGWVIGVGAAALVLVVFGVAALIPRGEAPSTATTIPSSPSLDTPVIVPTPFVPPARTIDGITHLELTLLDGSQISLAYPADLDLTSRGVEAEAAGGIGDVNRTLITRYGAPEEFIAQNEANQGPGELTNTYLGPDGGRVERWDFPDNPYLVFDFSPWTAFVWDTKFEVSENTEGWVNNLHGATDPDGFLVLTADPPLQLVDAADNPGPDGPDIRVDGSSGSLLVFINDCDRMTRLDEAAYGDEVFAFCDVPTNTLFYVGGGASFQQRIHESLEVSFGDSTTSTTTALRTPLIPIPDSNTSRDADPNLVRSPDWTFLDPGPLPPRWPNAMLWTGDEVVIWGGERFGGGGVFTDGAAFDPSTEEWRMLPPGPLDSDNEEEWVWTGNELVVWGSRQAMAWGPDTNEWRLVEDWPLIGDFYRQAVWTGTEIIDVNAGRAVDPASGGNRLIADPPQLGSRPDVVWTGTHVVIVTGEGSYDPTRDAWVEMPESGLTDLATSGTALGGQVVAADYEMGSAIYDPQDNIWTRLGDVPLRFFECSPRLHTVAETVVVEHCGGWAVFRGESGTWTPLAYPTPEQAWNLVAAGEDLYALGEQGFAVFSRSELLRTEGTPSRTQLGVAVVDLDEGWSVLGSQGGDDFEPFLAGPDSMTISSPSGGRCVVSALHGGALASLLSLYTTDTSEVTQVVPYVGGEPYPAQENPIGALDDLHHLTWPVSTTDLVDVGCTDADSTRQLSERIWSPWQ